MSRPLSPRTHKYATTATKLQIGIKLVLPLVATVNLRHVSLNVVKQNRLFVQFKMLSSGNNIVHVNPCRYMRAFSGLLTHNRIYRSYYTPTPCCLK